jgi:tetratricopeptide (TPR) repeat protein
VLRCAASSPDLPSASSRLLTPPEPTAAQATEAYEAAARVEPDDEHVAATLQRLRLSEQHEAPGEPQGGSTREEEEGEGEEETGRLRGRRRDGRLLGNAAFKAGDPALAVEWYTRGVTEKPHDHRLFTNRATCLLQVRIGRTGVDPKWMSSSRCRFATPAQSLSPVCSPCRGLRARRESAGAVLRSRAVFWSPNPSSDSHPKNHCTQVGNFQQALLDATRALELAPKWTRAWLRLAAALQGLLPPPREVRVVEERDLVTRVSGEERVARGDGEERVLANPNATHTQGWGSISRRKRSSRRPELHATPPHPPKSTRRWRSWRPPSGSGSSRASHRPRRRGRVAAPCRCTRVGSSTRCGGCEGRAAAAHHTGHGGGGGWRHRVAAHGWARVRGAGGVRVGQQPRITPATAEGAGGGTVSLHTGGLEYEVRGV